jgi:DNA-directed RNA polymerase specialized sigma24 family protein
MPPARDAPQSLHKELTEVRLESVARAYKCEPAELQNEVAAKLLSRNDVRNPRALILTAARNIAIGWCRKQKVRRAKQLPLNLPTTDRRPDAIDATEALRYLRERLSESNRETLELMIEHLSIAEIAERLGISYDAAAQRLARMRKSCRELLPDHCQCTD